jgi:hypothetical protein
MLATSDSEITSRLFIIHTRVSLVFKMSKVKVLVTTVTGIVYFIQTGCPDFVL